VRARRGCGYRRARIRAEPCEPFPSAWTACGFGAQAFYGASAFNANIGAWNVLSVTNFERAFDGTGLGLGLNSCATKIGIYSSWGSTFRTVYPTFSGSCTESPTSPPTPSPTLALAATAFSPLNAPVSDGAALTILGWGFGTADTKCVTQ
jgi:hypothetical protein